MLGHGVPQGSVSQGSGRATEEEVCQGSWWNVTGKHPPSLGEKMPGLRWHPLAGQQHMSADPKTGVGLRGGCRALLTQQTLSTHALPVFKNNMAE